MAIYRCNPNDPLWAYHQWVERNVGSVMVKVCQICGVEYQRNKIDADVKHKVDPIVLADDDATWDDIF